MAVYRAEGKLWFRITKYFKLARAVHERGNISAEIQCGLM